jgi:hypothetical protein
MVFMEGGLYASMILVVALTITVPEWSRAALARRRQGGAR